jgi:hypothetical protein
MRASSEVTECCLDFVEVRHRIVDGHYVDVADYAFQASRGSAHQVVKVGIEGTHEELSPDQLRDVALARLRSRIEKGYDPFAEDAPKTINVPSSSVTYDKDNYRIQQARLERLAKELAPGCDVYFDPDSPPTWVRMRVDDPHTGAILMVTSGDWHLTVVADKTNDEIRQLMHSWSGGRL